MNVRNVPVANNGDTIDDEAYAVMSRPEVARLADFIASKLAPDGEHSQGFMVYAVDETGSEVVRVAVAVGQNKPECGQNSNATSAIVVRLIWSNGDSGPSRSNLLNIWPAC